MFVPPAHLVVAETEHWIVNQRVTSRLPGYLVVYAKDPAATDLAHLRPAAQAELGPLLARVQAAVDAVLAPEHVLVSRWGLEPGHPVHFHVIPITRAVIDAYLADDRYRALMRFYSRPPLDDPEEFDGPDLTLFVARELGERRTRLELPGPGVEEVVARLRAALR